MFKTDMQIRLRQQCAHAVHEDLGGPPAQAELTEHVRKRSRQGSAGRGRNGALSDVPRQLLHVRATEARVREHSYGLVECSRRPPRCCNSCSRRCSGRRSSRDANFPHASHTAATAGAPARQPLHRIARRAAAAPVAAVHSDSDRSLFYGSASASIGRSVDELNVERSPSATHEASAHETAGNAAAREARVGAQQTARSRAAVSALLPRVRTRRARVQAAALPPPVPSRVPRAPRTRVAQQQQQGTEEPRRRRREKRRGGCSRWWAGGRRLACAALPHRPLTNLRVRVLQRCCDIIIYTSGIT